VNPTRTRGRLALTALLATGLLLTACGDDEPDEPAAAESAETTEATDHSSTTHADDTGDTEPAAVEDGVLTVEVSDYSFGELPETIPAGTRLEVTNTSSVEFHELVAFRLPDDEERSVEELLQLPEAELEAIVGGPPATVVLAGPDGAESTTALGDGTLNEPGRYALICFIPTGTDPAVYEEAAQNPEAGPPEPGPDAGPPHFVHGMHAEIVVE
jgi:hypothetical protein